MKKNFLIIFAIAFLLGCGTTPTGSESKKESVVKCRVEHVDWSKKAVIYEVNIRQYTNEGTFKAFMEHMPRLQELGIDILWLMPIHPIGEEKRKGTLGSYYSVKDYKGINPEFGSEEDFQDLVDKAHELGMYVILDWVANHTAWDHQWMKDHPGFYAKDSTGNNYGPFDWTDVAQLDFSQPKLHQHMIDAMEYWVREFNIDGYRCDVAGNVPRKFWDKARKSLDKIKPVFMLAEDEAKHLLLEDAFDMNYGWELHHIINEIAKGNMDVDNLAEYYTKEDSIYPKDCYRLQFITNHDENSWNGTEFERMGNGVRTFAALTFSVPGMPLLYTGQEFGMDKRLEFFEKDVIEYTENDFPEFYKSLISFKKENPLFWNGAAGGNFELLKTGNKHVFAFKRFTDTNEAFAIFNLSGNEEKITVPQGIAGAYKNYFKGESVVMNEGEKLQLAPWEYIVLLEK
jgi:glycosidase